MFVRPVEYVDFNGKKKTKDCYFNLNESEIIEMEVGVSGGFHDMLDKAIKSEDGKTLMALFKDLILKSYGVKSADGERFEKSEEISTAFYQTNVYNALFMELVFDAKKAAEFVNALFPKDLLDALMEKVEASINKQ